MGANEAGLLAGRYRVVGQLGRGGMGTVWRAHDEMLGREVAVKELRTFTDQAGPDLADLRLRMQREARAAARIRHPGVVTVHDVAEHEGRPVIVMELIDGPSLDAVVREQGAISPAEAARIGLKVLDALAAAHGAGVLHRDIKPSNILLARDGKVVLTDFGIATMEDPGDDGTTKLTASGELVGSVDYLAPERARGQQPGPASDMWSLGATLYAAVEGISPFRRSSTWSTISAIVIEPLPEPAHAGPLEPVLRALMEKDPAARADAARAAQLLSAAAAGEPVAEGPGGPGGHGGPETIRLGRQTEMPTPSTRPNAIPAPPQGQFGPPLPPAPTPTPATAAPAPTPTPAPATPAPPPLGLPDPPARRNRRRPLILVAAALAVVAVAVAAFTVPNMGSSGAEDPPPEARVRPAHSSAPASPTASPSRSASTSPKQSPEPTKAPPRTEQPATTPSATSAATAAPPQPEPSSSPEPEEPTRTVTATSDPWDACDYYSGTVLTQEGDTGQRVVQVQCILEARGYDVGAGGVDGIFGADTEAAVRSFQSDHRLDVDGLVGPDTWGALRG